MAEFLQGYGEDDARRERWIKRIALTLVVLAVGSGVAYFALRGYQEKRQADRFVRLLNEKNYNEAYRLWGCDPAAPCRDYSLKTFMEDWSRPAVLQAKAEDKNCTSGVIRTFTLAPNDKVHVWIDKKDRKLSFAPFEDSCRQPIVQTQ